MCARHVQARCRLVGCHHAAAHHLLCRLHDLCYQARGLYAAAASAASSSSAAATQHSEVVAFAIAVLVLLA